MALDFTQLTNAIARLGETVALYRQDASNEIVRDALIQRFEFTYDLAHKMVKRTLELIVADPAEIIRMSFPTLIRTADEYGLVKSGWPVWHNFREMRNITSHTYDQVKALKVAEQVPEFLDEVSELVPRLQQGMPQ